MNLLAFSKKDRIQHSMSKRKRKKQRAHQSPKCPAKCKEMHTFLVLGIPTPTGTSDENLSTFTYPVFSPIHPQAHACTHTHTRTYMHTHTHTLQPTAPPHTPILLIFLHLKIISEEFIHLGAFQALHLRLVPKKWDPDFANCAVLPINHQGGPLLSVDSALSFPSCLFVSKRFSACLESLLTEAELFFPTTSISGGFLVKDNEFISKQTEEFYQSQKRHFG